MDLKPLSNEEVEAIRSSVSWINWIALLQTGSIGAVVAALWKVFRLLTRLEKVESGLKELKESKPLTQDQHNDLMQNCQARVRSQLEIQGSELQRKIDQQNMELQVSFLKEMQEFRQEISAMREAQGHVLGELKQISNALSSLQIERRN